ncbi:MAG: hypothetical protein ABII96_05695, partial [Candidatus Zixiibacteriota bacterium]
MSTKRGVVILDPEGLEWQDGAALTALPPGIKLKSFPRTRSRARDMLVKFQPGYLEPRHTHDGYHSDLLL